MAMLALLLMGSLGGCNTLRGAGEDLKRTGEHIQNIGR
jgi:predicted small secreted protein